MPEWFLAQKSEIPRKQKVVFQFARRTCRNLQETMELSIAATAASFGDIGAGRDRTSPHLRREAVQFLPRVARRALVYGQSNLVRLIPDVQISKIFRDTIPDEKSCRSRAECRLPSAECLGSNRRLQILINRLRGLASRAHGEDHRSAAGHDIAAGEDPRL